MDSEDTINRCKCSTNITCKFCSIESMQYNLCDNCNTEIGYYPKKNDTNNIGKYINCYNNDTISDDYYLNLTTGYYELFYPNYIQKIDNKIIFNKLNSLIKEYSNEINTQDNSCENNYIEKKGNNNYNIILFKNDNKCTESEIPKKQPIIEFGECYDEIKKENNIENEELIVSKIEIKENLNSEKISLYSFYDPSTGERLNSSSCENHTIIIKEDFSEKLHLIKDKNEEFLLNLIDQEINIFNRSNDFYKDLCYHYKSPNNKDIPLKVRISEFYPNFTLYESGCDYI